MKRTHWSDRIKTPADKFKLDSNETVDTYMNFKIREFLKTLTSEHVTKYPDIKAAYHSLSEITQVSPVRLFLTAGADVAISSILHAIDIKQIHMNVPTYAMCQVYSHIHNIRAVPHDYELNENTFKRSYIKPSGAIYIAAPDSVTGTTISVDDIEEYCSRHTHVILDETYATHDMCYNDIINKYDNIFIIRSFSKTGGAAGLRVGYVLSCQRNIDLLYNNRPMFEINSIACEYIKYIKNNQNIIYKSRDNITKGKVLLEDTLLSQGYKVYMTHGNFTLTDYDHRLTRALSRKCVFRRVLINQVEYIRLTAASSDIMTKIVNEI